jgi:hypothetical protein
LAGVRVKGKPRTLVLVDTTARDRVFAILPRLLISILAYTIVIGKSRNGIIQMSTSCAVPCCSASHVSTMTLTSRIAANGVETFP